MNVWMVRLQIKNSFFFYNNIKSKHITENIAFILSPDNVLVKTWKKNEEKVRILKIFTFNVHHNEIYFSFPESFPWKDGPMHDNLVKKMLLEQKTKNYKF